MGVKRAWRVGTDRTLTSTGFPIISFNYVNHLQLDHLSRFGVVTPLLDAEGNPIAVDHSNQGLRGGEGTNVSALPKSTRRSDLSVNVPLSGPIQLYTLVPAGISRANTSAGGGSKHAASTVMISSRAI